jgi:hypothetical protein
VGFFVAALYPARTRTTAAADPGTHENTIMETQRNRAWRRSQSRHHGGDHTAPLPIFKPEKNWKLMYTRGDKLLRARQLGFTYPVLSPRQLLDQEC